MGALSSGSFSLIGPLAEEHSDYIPADMFGYMAAIVEFDSSDFYGLVQ